MLKAVIFDVGGTLVIPSTFMRRDGKMRSLNSDMPSNI
jgi:hypothetical protein